MLRNADISESGLTADDNEKRCGIPRGYDEFWSTYEAFNDSHKRTIRFALGHTGLFSELRLLANAIWFGIVTRRRCMVTDHRWTAGPDEGWSRIFSSPLPLESNPPEPVSRDPDGVVNWTSKCIVRARSVLHIFSRFNPLPSHYTFLLAFPHINELYVHRFTHGSRRWLTVRSDGNMSLRSQRPEQITNAEGVALAFDMLRKPNADVRRQMDDILQGIDTSEPFSAVHLRAGDKWWGEATPIHDLEVFARPIRQRGLRRVVIASDDHHRATALKSILDGFDVTVLSRETDKGYDGLRHITYASADRTSTIVDALAAFEVMTRADFLVGTGSSNVGRMAAVARRAKGWCDVEHRRNRMTETMLKPYRDATPDSSEP